MSEWDTNQGQQQLQTQIQQSTKVQKSEYKMQQIVSDRATEQIEDDLTTLHNKQYQTPLSFYVKLDSGYLFSFRNKQLISFIMRLVCLSMFTILTNVFIFTLEKAPKNAKIALLVVSCVELLSFGLLFFLDPGTLFEDQEEKIDQERLYCQTCRIYKSYNSTHCVFCVKCVKGYDHHCGFFSKCIGKRNYLLFILFILSTILVCVLSIGILVYTVIDISRKVE